MRSRQSSNRHLDDGPGKPTNYNYNSQKSLILQAFELRYKNFCGDDADKRNTSKRKQSSSAGISHVKSDTEYYNDLPNKAPPEFSETSSSASEKRRVRLHSNLIDFNTSFEHQREEEYVNESDGNTSDVNYSNNNNASRDVFDMQCFSISPAVQKKQLLIESWYHGPISRAISESLLRNDGDFLVRESQGSASQYVLTGLNGQPKHLLLIDPEGVVRTKDRVFENITHLINYHWSNRLPIISSDSAILLQTPVIRITDLRN